MINVTDAVTVKFKLKLSQLIDVVSGSLLSSPLSSMCHHCHQCVTIVLDVSPLLSLCHCVFIVIVTLIFIVNLINMNIYIKPFIFFLFLISGRYFIILILVFKSNTVKFHAFLGNFLAKTTFRLSFVANRIKPTLVFHRKQNQSRFSISESAQASDDHQPVD